MRKNKLIKKFSNLFLILLIILIFFSLNCFAKFNIGFTSNFIIPPPFTNISPSFINSLLVDGGFKLCYIMNDFYILGFYLDLSTGIISILKTFETIGWIVFFPISIGLKIPFPEIPPTIGIINLGIVTGINIVNKPNFKLDFISKFGFGSIEIQAEKNIQASFYSIKPELNLKYPLAKFFGFGLSNSNAFLFLKEPVNNKKIIYYSSLGLYIYFEF
ncbi:MAG: hypothetical protein N3A58_06780 [Spirochaetes bacterium]|nr:hypothetical protein [Spirochaetota bacterium]